MNSNSVGLGVATLPLLPLPIRSKGEREKHARTHILSHTHIRSLTHSLTVS